MKRFLKYLGLVIVVVCVLFYIVANHSISGEHQIACKGSFYVGGKAIGEEEIFFKFRKYRWWVHLWSDSDGEVYGQSKDEFYLSFRNEIVDGWGDVIFDGGKKGRYLAMSRTMRFINGGQLFEGKCVDIK
jgi:hypothetical protein